MDFPFETQIFGTKFLRLTALNIFMQEAVATDS